MMSHGILQKGSRLEKELVIVASTFLRSPDVYLTAEQQTGVEIDRQTQISIAHLFASYCHYLDRYEAARAKAVASLEEILSPIRDLARVLEAQAARSDILATAGLSFIKGYLEEAGRQPVLDLIVKADLDHVPDFINSDWDPLMMVRSIESEIVAAKKQVLGDGGGPGRKKSGRWPSHEYFRLYTQLAEIFAHCDGTVSSTRNGPFAKFIGVLLDKCPGRLRSLGFAEPNALHDRLRRWEMHRAVVTEPSIGARIGASLI